MKKITITYEYSDEKSGTGLKFSLTTDEEKTGFLKLLEQAVEDVKKETHGTLRRD